MPYKKSVQFGATYYGSVTLDRRYTPSMLPWAVAEVRIRSGADRKTVLLTVGKASLVVDATTRRGNGHVLEHRLDKIRRFIQAPANVGEVRDGGSVGHRRASSTFAYLTRDSTDAPTQCCHVFDADNESTVQDLFTVLQEATKESAETAVGGVPGSENATQRFEILYVGKIRVSHCKPPPTFVDEAVEKFRVHELEKLKQLQDTVVHSVEETDFRRRHSSGTSLINLYSHRENDLTRESELLGCSHVNGSAATTAAADTSLLKDGNDSGVVIPSGWLYRGESLGNGQPIVNIGDASPVFSDGSPRECGLGYVDGGRRRIRNDSITHCQNRTMVFQIGLTEVSFVSLDKKSTILNKSFKDIAHCSQGIKNKDHFGFICRDSTCENYFGYILRCQAQSVTEEIMTTLKQVFASAAAQQRALRRQFVICEACPMLWLHKLCVELEGLSVSKSHNIILQRLDTLPAEEKTDILTKLEGAEVISKQEQNEVLMMLLRAWCEMKQAKHVHVDMGHCSKHDPSSILGGFFDRKHSSNSSSVLDDLKNKARRSLSNSFETILKRKTKDVSRREGFRERSNTLDFDSRRDSSGGSSPASTPDRSCEFLGFESGQEIDQEFRRRSSTIAGTRDARHTPTRVAKQKTSPMMSIFMKVGNPPKANSTPSSDEERWSSAAMVMSTPMTTTTEDLVLVTPTRKESGSWRQAIFKRVVTPQQKPRGTLQDISPRMKSTPLLSVQLLKRSPEALRYLWKKAIRQQILLIRMERENKKLKASQDAVQVKRVKLSYEEITPCLIRITKVWEEMLRAPKGKSFDFADLMDAIKSGVPRQRRGEIWQLLAEQYKLTNADDPLLKELELPAPYEDLIKQLTAQQHAILIDLGRTFPSHPYFTDSLGAGQLSLFNLLKAYSLLDAEVGYCQGLSFIAGVLLLHMEENSAFDMLKHIMFTLGVRRQFKPDMVALQIQMYQLSRLIHDQHRELHDHFEKYEIAPTLYAAPWFLTLFASQFPLGFVSRVFDLIFLYGIEVAFKVAVVLLGNHKELIVQCKSFESVMDFLKTTLPSMGIIQMERVFNQVLAMDIGKQLSSYEIEYNVLQEEMQAGSQSYQANEFEYELAIQRLESANANLKHQNAELLGELQATQGSLMTLERQISSYQACTSRQESKLKCLTLERATLKHLVEALRRNWPSEHYDICSDVLSNYQDVLRSESPINHSPPSAMRHLRGANSWMPVLEGRATLRNDSRTEVAIMNITSQDHFLSAATPPPVRARNESGDSLCSSHGSLISSEIHTD